MEQLQTNRFLDGLRRAVDKNLRNRGIWPNTHHIPNYAYNQTAKELARLHQQPNAKYARLEPAISDSPVSYTHLTLPTILLV